MTVQLSTYWLLLIVALIRLSAANELHNSLINSSTLEVNEPRREDKGRKIKIAKPKDPLVVQTKSGYVKGIRVNALGKNVDVFMGIPFAKPPLGDLRFKRPIPVDPWHGILNATEPPNSCMQQPYEYFPDFKGEQMWNPNTQLSEDCLYLNIWAPSNLREQGAEPQEVLVWIYGGGFMGGTITLDIYDADIMAAANNFIVASMQYRVGAFGYLYLDNEEAAGNQGMYDQALALKWIKDNIAYFGGNPERITLFGESAGGSSITIHLLSPVSMHLFDRAIIQSGVVNCPWSIMTREKAYNIGVTLVDDIGCNSTLLMSDWKQVMECMRNANASAISLQQWNSYFGILQFPSAPIVDGAFLPDEPLEMLKRGQCKKTELLLGSNRDEGTFWIIYDYMQYFQKDEATYLERKTFLEIMNDIFKSLSPIEREAIIFQYTDWEHIDNGFLNQKAVGDVVGDYYFVCPSNLFANLYAKHCDKVYYYFFTHRTSINPWGKWMGVLHADEIDYVFGHPLNETEGYSNTEAELSRRIMEYYKKFAATGRPVEDSINWPIYTEEEPHYFEWNGARHSTGKGPRATPCAFWNELMPLLQQKEENAVCESEMQKALNSAVSLGVGLLVWLCGFIVLARFI